MLRGDLGGGLAGNPFADAPGLDERDLQAPVTEQARGGDADDAAADDRHVRFNVACQHVVAGCWGSGVPIGSMLGHGGLRLLSQPKNPRQSGPFRSPTAYCVSFRRWRMPNSRIGCGPDPPG